MLHSVMRQVPRLSTQRQGDCQEGSLLITLRDREDSVETDAVKLTNFPVSLVNEKLSSPTNLSSSFLIIAQLIDLLIIATGLHVCQAYKLESRKVAGKLQQTIVRRPWEMVGVDLMGPFPRSLKRNLYLLVFVDYYSRLVELFPLRKATAESVTKVLIQDILTRWGVPDYLLSDQGPQFIANVFEETCKEWNLRHKMTTAYHPQTNLTERVNRTLKTMIASFVGDNHKQWDKHLPEFRFALNSAINESTGVTPAELNLSRPLRGPLEAMLLPRPPPPDSLSYPKIA